ncbi:hypothetical protein [Waterburya agarophytonicola]|nr:hypothetical protein [Waterburya agarophytonicola]
MFINTLEEISLFMRGAYKNKHAFWFIPLSSKNVARQPSPQGSENYTT